MTVELVGAERRYVVDFVSTNARCRIEQVTGLEYSDVVRALARRRPKVSLARQVFHAALVDPPAASVDAEGAGTILDDVGGPQMVMDAFRGLTQVRVPGVRRRV